MTDDNSEDAIKWVRKNEITARKIQQVDNNKIKQKVGVSKCNVCRLETFEHKRRDELYYEYHLKPTLTVLFPKT